MIPALLLYTFGAGAFTMVLVGGAAGMMRDAYTPEQRRAVWFGVFITPFAVLVWPLVVVLLLARPGKGEEE